MSLCPVNRVSTHQALAVVFRSQARRSPAPSGGRKHWPSKSVQARGRLVNVRGGTKMGKAIRMTNSTTGGPVFVYVKDGGIVRMTPMDFDETDAPSWKIE